MRIAIIGGGYAGAALALHLLRQNAAASLQLDIFEPRERLGAGATYATSDPGHRVNIRAERMSLDPDDRDHFARWFDASGQALADPDARSPAGQVFPQRETFGRYVAEQVQEAATTAVSLQHHRTRAEAVTRREPGFLVKGADGTQVEADAVALCLGNPAAEAPRQLLELASDHPKIVADPWASGALAAIAPDDRVLILGTGLTTADVVVSLLGVGHRGRILAVSRRGLLPRPRSGGAVEAYGAISPGDTLREIVAAIRRAIREAAASGRSWQDVIETIRLGNAALWAAFSDADKRRFLRHVKPYWDVHRFQMAPQVESVLRNAMAVGQLLILRASLQQVGIAEGRFAVVLRPRGADLRSEVVDAIVNCTGPSRRALFRNPAVASLADQHLVRPDPFDLGLDVDDACRARAADGAPVAGLYVVGPPTRGTKGEVTGASEVAEQAATVARHLLESLSPDPAIPAADRSAP